MRLIRRPDWTEPGEDRRPPPDAVHVSGDLWLVTTERAGVLSGPAAVAAVPLRLVHGKVGAWLPTVPAGRRDLRVTQDGVVEWGASLGGQESI